MKYTAPDGYVMESLPYPEIINYKCNCQDIIDGIYFSVETTGSSTEIGIQQIKIKRIVDNNLINIFIVMSSDEELINYINSNITPVLNF